jgi:hypothetical protein
LKRELLAFEKVSASFKIICTAGLLKMFGLSEFEPLKKMVLPFSSIVIVLIVM